MKKLYTMLTIASLFLLCSCGGNTSKFPMEKKYWGPKEYEQVISDIRFLTPEDEKYPTLDDPETAAVFKKLIDRENINVVADDASLGVRFKAQFMSDLFDQYRALVDTYKAKMDQEDKFVYDVELAEILNFGLYLQVYYFKLGNDQVVAEADTPASAQSTVDRNEQIIVGNFNNYLDFVNYERSFSARALDIYILGLDDGFSFLIATFPNAPYQTNISKAEAMEKKAAETSLKEALNRLVVKLKATSVEKVNP